MIKVENLCKKYNNKTVVDHISFEVGRGEIIGLLGRNGAGKTTTLRVLSTFLAPSSGKITIDNLDIFKDSQKIRQIIGYMPENIPLYKDLRVREHLKFRASIRGLAGKKRRRAINEALEIFNLRDVRRKLVKNLSKGYKQRLGMADAMINKPKILFLDEPTSGLDPHQVHETSEFIKKLSERHTVIISSHRLQEIEKVSTRVIIMENGKILASDSPQNLAKHLSSNSEVIIEIKAEENYAKKKILQLPGIKKISSQNDGLGWVKLTIKMNANTEIRDRLFQLITHEKWQLREFRKKNTSLEQTFLEITLPEKI